VRRLAAILAGRCPRCLEGRVWRGIFTMNETCPVCGLRFEREIGYWTGAMVASYAIGIPVLALIFLAVWLTMQWDFLVVLLVADALFFVAAPFVWRYSRIVWLHLDWLIDPVTAPPGASAPEGPASPRDSTNPRR
jgi:uncharacterized protein (DUF983 family)